MTCRCWNISFFEKSAKGYSKKRVYRRKIKEFGAKLVKFPKRVYRHFESKKYLTGGYEQKLFILNTDETHWNCWKKEYF